MVPFDLRLALGLYFQVEHLHLIQVLIRYLDLFELDL